MTQAELYKIFRALVIVYGEKSGISLFKKLINRIK
jgi:hypothetical protein